MRAHKGLILVATIVTLLLVGFVATRLFPNLSTTALSVSSVAPKPTPIMHYGLENGTITDTLISPDDVTIHVTSVVKQSNRWLFHIHTHNNADKSVAFLDSNTDHYFMVAGIGKAGVPAPASQVFLKLTPPTQIDSATLGAQGVALPTSLTAHSDSDGWLVADISHYQYGTPVVLLYVYGTVQSTACPSLTSTVGCHPNTGYRTLSWRLS